jgi:hypothetical protein
MVVDPKLIGISGKIGNGKDLLFDVINYVITEDYWTSFEHYMHESRKVDEVYENKKFAGILKDITCKLIGCNVSQLEDREFKEKELGEEWNIWVLVPNPDHDLFDGNCQLQEGIFSSSDEAKRYIEEHKIINVLDIEKRALTPRKLLQLLGTEAGRQIIHPNIWVNALFAEHKKEMRTNANEETELFNYPNWIITDVRFPNEAKAIKDRGGIMIRVNRLTEEEKNSAYKARAGRPNNAIGLIFKDEHASETGLDNYDKFDYVIENDGTVQDLIDKVKSLNIVKRIL